jgi:hypothetical protein
MLAFAVATLRPNVRPFSVVRQTSFDRAALATLAETRAIGRAAEEGIRRTFACPWLLSPFSAGMPVVVKPVRRAFPQTVD